ncbi:GNAT family N-acetyltransferase [Jiella mangrovi]|uniref:N-acetyltransferase n=1 Tax=Jiella mangrovi TaxID=2821407 RepID=A0ABS4BFQ5_9HYPH|nr:GNAT family N-acetyltransferase [Jiella mangrovi]MBP0615588.1 N-acetyltransferase [Jiella mangrovi]
MAGAYVLRPAEEADLRSITAIYAHEVETGTATYELAPPDEAEMRRRFLDLKAKHYPYLVAEDHDGAVIGYAYAGTFRVRPAYNWFVEDSIYLAPEARGRRVGTALLTRLIEECERLGFRQMLAVIGGSDNHGSVRLHGKLGFQMIGTMPATGLKFGRWVDTVLMQRPLGEGAQTIPDKTAYPGDFTALPSSD